jgi:hypothetical protein
MIKKLFLNFSLVIAISFGAAGLHAAIVPVSLTASPDPIGDGWFVECTRSIFGTCIEWGVAPTEDHSISIELSDSWTDVFNVSFQTTYANPNGLVQGSLIFASGADTRGELVPLDNVTADFLLGGSLLDISFTVLDPNRFMYTLDGTAFMLPEDLVIPIPAAIWLFGSGLLGLVGMARRKKAG